jgi:PAS domain S-box-containing protein
VANRSERRARSRRREDIERDRLFTLSLDLLCVCGFDGRLKQLNPAFERVLGYPVDHLKERPFIEFVVEEDRERTRAHYQSILDGEQSVRFENRWLHQDGSYRWLQWNGIADPEHQVIYATARDVTERKHAEAELSRLAAIVESSDDAIISMSLRGVIDSWNPGAQELFGYRSAEVIDKPMSLLIPPGHADHTGQILDQIRRGQKVTHYETLRRRKDGAVIGVSLSVSPVRDATGRVIGASVIARDVTARRQAESERLAKIQELEHTLHRTKRLSGMLPICISCKRVSDAAGMWHEVEEYIADHSDAKPSPALCPDCAAREAAGSP